jgi:hypothetical protein
MNNDFYFDISQIFGDLEENIIFRKITQTQINYEAVNVSTDILFKGIVFPLKAEELSVKGEGERSFTWYKVYTNNKLEYATNDRMVINGVIYKIMNKYSYTRQGYFKYEVVEDFQNNL